MNIRLKIILMFLPLAVLFALVALVSVDGRNPQVLRLNCRVLNTGPAASAVRRSDNVLYANSDNPQTDISLECAQIGTAVVNDTDLFQSDIASGNPAVVTKHRYQYLPDRWKVEINTGHDGSQTP